MRGSQGDAQNPNICRVFLEHMSSLYLLSLLLTGNREQAEQCFVAGIEDCAGDNHGFQEWAHAWARRVIIQNAIRLTAPLRSPAIGAQDLGNSKTDIELLPARTGFLAGILRLDARDRFVFVLSVLEGYSDHDCAILLRCTRRAVVARRRAALLRLAKLNATCVGSAELVQASSKC